jgi:hypothetical protein
MGGLEFLLTMIGIVFLVFLVLSSAVEMLVEVLRATLERFGWRLMKSKVSLEETMQLVRDFAGEEIDFDAKLHALRVTARQLSRNGRARFPELEAPDSGTSTHNLNEVAARVWSGLRENEARRIFTLRFLSAIIGCALVWISHFHVFEVLADALGSADWISRFPGLGRRWVNVVVGGLAAAAGSSYWHDKLDAVRNVKAKRQ